jgi:riboflavin kinase/FMN adenylyltransferase
MEFIRHLDHSRPGTGGCVATVGNFDGVHLGHQALIREVVEHARQLAVPASVMLFEPQPLEYFSPAAAPVRLTTLREKIGALRGQAIDRLVCLRFDSALARLEAGEFVESLLLRGMGVRRMIVGDDFRFGRDRRGDFDLLAQLGSRHGFDVVPTETLLLRGERISSSRIRAALNAADLESAAVLLGRRYRICGRVVPGDRRGRELGFATANIDLHGRGAPLRGIFAVRVHGLEGGIRDGVASLGTRPVFDGRRLLLETHLFDFAADIYGRRIEVEFVHFLRPERNFGSVEALRRQMHLDAEQARQVLKEDCTVVNQ